MVFRRDAKNLADDGDRERVGEVAHHVHLAVTLYRIEQVIHYGLNARAHAFHRAHGEHFTHQGPQPGVVRRVGVDQPDGVVMVDRFGLLAHRLGQTVQRERVAACVGEAERIAHCGDDIIVAGQHPTAHDLAPMHGVFSAQFMIDRVGIVVELRLVQM